MSHLANRDQPEASHIIHAYYEWQKMGGGGGREDIAKDRDNTFNS